MATQYNFKLVDRQNLEAFLNALNVPAERVQKALTAEATIEITTKDAEGFTVFTTTYPSGSITQRYKLDEPFEYQRGDGKTIKAKVTRSGAEGQHVYTTVENDGEKEVTHVREFADGKLKSTSTYNGVSAVLTYEKA